MILKGRITQTRIMMKRGAKPEKPIMIVGLPGIGSVGKIVVEQIRKEYKAERIATIYSPHFPSHVMMTKKGGIRLVSNRLYLIRQKPNDILLLTGDYQPPSPEGQYYVNSDIVEFFKDRLGGTFIYTVGGYVSHNGTPGRPRVFANATTKNVIKQFSKYDIVFGRSRGAIWGAAGMLLAFAKMRKLSGICLLGETSLMDFDATAAKAVLEVLSKTTHLKVKIEGLDSLIKEAARVESELAQQMSAQEEDKDRKLSYIR